MRKNIKQVRRDIQRRRRIKSRQPKSINQDRVMSSFPSEEDKHGDIQMYPKHTTLSQRSSRSIFSMSFLKVFSALAIFLFAFVVFKTNFFHTSTPKYWLETQLTKEFPFATVNAWYYERFGRPLAFNPKVKTVFNNDNVADLPVLGHISETFHENGQGIKISPEKSTSVKAWKEGIIIFTGNDRMTKKTVTIQHADYSETTYGYLSTLDVHPYQYVAEGQVIGMFQPSGKSTDVYFSIEKDDIFIDPAQVIQVDDR